MQVLLNSTHGTCFRLVGQACGMLAWELEPGAHLVLQHARAALAQHLVHRIVVRQGKEGRLPCTHRARRVRHACAQRAALQWRQWAHWCRMLSSCWHRERQEPRACKNPAACSSADCVICAWLLAVQKCGHCFLCLHEAEHHVERAAGVHQPGCGAGSRACG